MALFSVHFGVCVGVCESCAWHGLAWFGLVWRVAFCVVGVGRGFFSFEGRWGFGWIMGGFVLCCAVFMFGLVNGISERNNNSFFFLHT